MLLIVVIPLIFAQTIIQKARIQFCGCQLAFSEALCLAIADCRWNQYQCSNITGIPITIANNATNITNTNTTNSNNSTSNLTIAITYNVTLDFDYDSVVILPINKTTTDDTNSTNVGTNTTNTTNTTTTNTTNTTNTTTTNTTSPTNTTTTPTNTTTNTTTTPTNTTTTNTTTTNTTTPTNTTTTTNTTDTTTTNTTDTSTNSTNTTSTTNTTNTTTTPSNTTTTIQQTSLTWLEVYVTKGFSDKVTCSQQSDEKGCNSKRWPDSLFCLWNNGTCVDSSCTELEIAECENTFFCISYGYCTSCLPQSEYGNWITIIPILILISVI